MSLISFSHVSRTYDMGTVRVHALRNVSMTIEEGEFVAILGPSGSGKSTMMSILGCLDRPTSGEYQLAGAPVASLSDDRLAAIRSRTIGFVFQSYNLLPRTSAIDNVATPLLYQGVPRRDRLRRAGEALERLGLGDRLGHEPTELSGGEQQRAAIARALVTSPELLLADEPTGNLDSRTGQLVLDLLRRLNRDQSLTVVMVTHSAFAATYGDRTVELRDGVVIRDVRAPSEPTGRVIPLRE
jgi:ABC-type lipoprotein export system ATPase subunit